MNLTIQEYIERINLKGFELKSIIITNGKLDGFERLLYVLYQNITTMRNISEITITNAKQPFNLDLSGFEKLHKLDLRNSNVQQLTLPLYLNLENMKISLDMCSESVKALVHSLQFSDNSDSDSYSEVEDYEMQDLKMQDYSMQQLVQSFVDMRLQNNTPGPALKEFENIEEAPPYRKRPRLG